MTRYLDSSKSLFSHIPRTGGTWINQAISQLGITYAKWVEDKVPEGFPQKHTPLYHYDLSILYRVGFHWSVVRHPIAYYESVYRYINQNEEGRDWLQTHVYWHPLGPAAREWKPLFSDWVKAMRDSEPCFVTRLYEIFVGPEGGEICDFIGRTETLEEDFFLVMEMLGHEKQTSESENAVKSLGVVRNKRARGKGKTKWTDELKQDVEDVESVVCRRFYGENFDKRRYRTVK